MTDITAEEATEMMDKALLERYEVSVYGYGRRHLIVRCRVCHKARLYKHEKGKMVAVVSLLRMVRAAHVHKCEGATK